MWYFAWILGVSLAALLAVVNAMMYEVRQDNEARAARADEPR
jgi:cyd operon protein YbgT